METIENSLIPIYKNTNGDKLVNARELHEFLEVETRFNDWITRKLEKYDFIKDIDFTTITQNRVVGATHKDVTEYILTLDAAKEISMVENNTKGKQARKYFITVEKKYKNQIASFGSKIEEIRTDGEALKLAVDILKPSEVSKVKMLRQFNESKGLSTVYLPQYTDEHEGHSATELLERFNIATSTIKFNKAMIEKGFIEELTRKSTNKKGFKKYKKLTDKGLHYGKNVVSAHGTEKETQPLYYSDKFQELTSLLGLGE